MPRPLDPHERRASFSLLAHYFEASQQPVWLLDAEACEYLYLNPALSRLAGFADQAFADQPAEWRERVHPDDQQAIERALGLSVPMMHLIRVRHAQGHELALEVEVRPLADPVLRLFVGEIRLGQGLPARPPQQPAFQPREELEQAVIQLQEISETLPGGLFQFCREADGRYCFPFISPTIGAYWGFDTARWQDDGARCLDEIHAEDRARVRQSIEDAVTDHLSWDCKFRAYSQHQQRYVWIRGLSLPRPLPAGGWVWNGSLLDIDAAELSQAQLREQTQRLQTILDSLGEGIAIFEREGSILTLNAIGTDILGQGGVSGDPAAWSETYGLYDDDGLRLYPAEAQPLLRALEGETVRNVEQQVHTPTGECRSVLITGSPLIDAQGKLTGAVAVFRDITDLRQAQAAAENAHEHLSYVLERLSQGFLTAGRDGRLSSHNPAARELTGVASAEAMNKMTLQELFPDGFEQTLPLLTKPEAESLQLQAYHPVLDTRYQLAIYAHHHELAVFFQDITEVWRHEKLMSLEKQMLSSLLASENSLDETIATLLHDYENVFPGRTACLLRMAPLEVPLAPLNAPSLPEDVSQRWLALLNEQSVAQWQTWLAGSEFRYWHAGEPSPAAQLLPDLGYANAVMVPIESHQGELTAVLAICYGQAAWLERSHEAYFLQRIRMSLQTIIEYKQQHWQLGHTQQRFHQFSQVTTDAIWDCDLHSRQLRWNQALTSLFGYASELLESDLDWWLAAIHPDEQARVASERDTALQQGREDWKAEYRFRCADGSYRWVFDRGRILYDQQGQPSRMFGSLQDTHQLRLQREQLLAQNQRLLEVAWRQSHEVRRPLANLLGLLDLLRQDPGETQLVELLLSEAQQLDQIVQAIVKISSQVLE